MKLKVWNFHEAEPSFLLPAPVIRDSYPPTESGLSVTFWQTDAHPPFSVLVIKGPN